MLSTADLRALGLDRHAVLRRVRSGFLTPVYPRVFAVGAAELSARGRLRAAWLSGGERVLIGHRSATLLWELLPEWNGPVDLLVSGGRGPSHPGLRVHRTRWLPDEHRSNRHGIAVVSPARAVLDAGIVLPDELHELVIAAALRKRLVTRAELESLARLRRPGARPLRAQLARLGGPQFTRSRAERILLDLIRRAGLPPPTANHGVRGHERDLVWPEQQVIVEFDGFAFHWSAGSMRRDHRRDAEMTARDWRTLRFTWAELTEQPYAVVAQLAATLAIPPAFRDTQPQWVSGNTPPA